MTFADDPDKAVGHFPAVAAVPTVSDKAVAVPMVPDKAVGHFPAVAAIPMDLCKAVCRTADNSDYNYMPFVFPPADRLLIIDYAFIHLSCIINKKSISGSDNES